MKAIILAAGRGERLRPLTDSTPKPLVRVGGRMLIEYHLKNLAAAGITEVVINTAWLAENIHQSIGDGSRYELNIRYSDEGKALETAGGIANALPLLGEEPFLVINGDIWSDFDFSTLKPLDAGILAHLILVANPNHHPQGDFAITNGKLDNNGQPRYTYSGIGVYSPQMFAASSPGKAALAPLLKKNADSGLISAQHYNGHWTDVGTLERLQSLEQYLDTNRDSTVHLTDR